METLNIYEKKGGQHSRGNFFFTEIVEKVTFSGKKKVREKAQVILRVGRSREMRAGAEGPKKMETETLPLPEKRTRMKRN